MLELAAIPLFLAGLLNIVMSLAVLARGARRLVNISFFALAFSMAGWTVGIAAFLLSNDPGVAFMWAKIYYFFPLTIAAGLVMFVKSFPNHQRIPKTWSVPVLSAFVVLAALLITQHGFVTDSLIYHDWGKEILLNKRDYLFYSIYLLICFPVSLLHIFQKSKQERGLYSSQAHLFFVGFLLTAIFGVFFNLVLPWVGNYRLIWAGPLFTNIFIATIAYSIVRHRMFDVRLLVARTLGYALSVFSLGVLYGVVAFSVLNSFLLQNDSLTLQQQITFTSLAVIIALTFRSIKKFFDRLTNRIFYRDAYDPQALLDDLNKVLVSSVDLERLLRQSSGIMQGHLKAEFCLFGLKETESAKQRVIGTNEKHFRQTDIDFARTTTPHIRSKVIVADYLESDNAELLRRMQNNDIAILVRLVATTEMDAEGVGYLLLGAKKSGNPYNSQDIRVLEIIANELVIAIQNALRFEEIQNFNVTLQQKVNDATKQLRHTNEKLRLLDETKDDFISMASHQLRTPLTSVKGYLSMVLEGDVGGLNRKQDKMLNQAFISSQRMVYLIADLLNVSRLKTGKFIIEPAPVNLAEVIESEVDQLVETAAARGLKLSYGKPKTFPALMLDETKIRQVIMNFIDNAIYYTPEGGHIHVRLSETTQTVTFTVEDDGIGVPKHEQHHLFTKFFRAHNARKARPDGTGLGLFMAKKVIIVQGGSVVFKSREGRGSVFGFTFAKAKLEPPKVEHATPAQTPEERGMLR
jgi:signal transduction histidine kinase